MTDYGIQNETGYLSKLCPVLFHNYEYLFQSIHKMKASYPPKKYIYHTMALITEEFL